MQALAKLPQILYLIFSPVWISRSAQRFAEKVMQVRRGVYLTAFAASRAATTIENVGQPSGAEQILVTRR
jgi:hypothetical protein